ncbi:hypothetical protein [Bradyrhizobium prioriisuperbiae]|uniref:hypothetical protein n=1 Tax=Bradyrhizobium prioriisuperbiae TaxID=2854389 RepID=UPI0028F00400|nr:hypothetical protein [Bradyrhizobium prioritasuperba]
MALFEEFSIRGAIEGTAYAHAQGIFIAYPNRIDWKKRYRPKPLRMPDDNGIYHSVNEFEQRYQDMKHHHETMVTKMLDRIRHHAAGRAVLAELKERQSYSVNIFPFDFLNSSDWAANPIALTQPVAVPQTAKEIAHDRKPLGTSMCVEGSCFGFRQASSVELFYSPHRDSELADADGTLLHELVHAVRFQRGNFRSKGKEVNGGYKNQEEFFANVIEMIYRSEKRQSIFDYRFHPIHADTFLDKPLVPTPRELLTAFRQQQGTLFDALVRVEARFNPMRQMDIEAGN